MKLEYLRKFGLPTLACFFIAFNACESDDNPSPDDDTEVTGGGTGGSSGGSGGTGGGSGGTGGNTTSTSNAGGAGGSGGTGTETTTGGGGEAGETSTDSGGTSAGGTGGTGTGGTGGTGLPECDEPNDDDCYDLAACAPTEEVHVLDQCTESACFSFDNAARLPLYNGGDLPAVP